MSLAPITRTPDILNRLGIRRKIAKKIGYGYAIAIGMAIVGTSTGLLLGNYYSQKAQERVDLFSQKQELLDNLNSQVLGLQLHPSRLLTVDGLWRAYEINQFTLDVKTLRELLTEIHQFASIYGLAAGPLSQRYGEVLADYEMFMAEVWQQTESNTIAESGETEAGAIAALLSTEQSTQLSLRFETLSEELTRLLQTTENEHQAALVQRQQAEKLRIIIIITGILLSSGVAIAMAIITSQAIARPIETVTAVARQVTQSADFELQAPITTQDEVALLAEALNQLIAWTGQYTEELRLARDTLEQRVQERTHALQESEHQQRQQAEDLRQTLSELQQTQLHLVQSEKMAGLGQMVAGIAHEINNPVGFIYGNIQHIKANTEDLLYLIAQYQKHYPQPVDEVQAIIEDIDLEFLKQDAPTVLASVQNGAERIRDIVKSLRNFSRLDESAVKTVNIHDGLDSTLTILQNRLKGDRYHPPIQVNKHYDQLPSLDCHAGQLNQVFMNILSNAIDALHEKYTRQGGAEDRTEATDHLARTSQEDRVQPTQTNGSASSPLPQLDIHTDHREDWVLIQITDNGPGIDSATLQKLFDPFFTTKEVGKGTGLGLSISYQIVTQTHNGILECASRVGEGTTFTIKLPKELSSPLPVSDEPMLEQALVS